MKIEGMIQRVIYDSQRFFRNTRIIHIVLTVLFFGIGITSVILSDGSDGTAQVPYFFSAFIAAAWHIVFVVNCQVCIYYLSVDVDRSREAPTWIRVYSVSSSVFVLFNVMGVVFTVVNGMCVEDQMCYYDQNKTANRLMAICLIILHCVSILFSVFLAKRAHLIDSELNTDIGIKLNHVINFLRTRRQRSVASIPQSEISDSKRTSPSQNSDRTEVGLSEVQNKGGHILTTIEISAMAHRKTHRRSKSQPNMVKQLGLQKPDDVKGQVFSIYSDTEMDETDEQKKKKRSSKHSHHLLKPALSPRVRSKSENNVDNLPSDEDSFAGKDSFSQSFASNRESIASSKNGGHSHQDVDEDVDEDVILVKSAAMDEAAYRQQILLLKQEKVQKQQEKLLEEQRKLFLAQKHVSDVTSAEGAPPPYENGDSPNYKSMKDNGGYRDDVLL